MSNLFLHKGAWMPVKTFLILVIIALSLLVLISSYLLHNAFSSIGVNYFQNINNQTTSFIDYNISATEKIKINNWIEKNYLNQYGDPINTQYQGSPLADRVTGENIDRYRLILRKYPQRPWNKNNE